MNQILTKTIFLYSEKCLRKGWYACNNFQDKNNNKKSKNLMFYENSFFKSFVKKSFPNGTLFSDKLNYDSDDFKKGVGESSPIFDFHCMSDSCRSTIDILSPTKDGGWDIIEIQSSSSVKDYYVKGVAFKRYCLLRMGFIINDCYLLYVDKNFVFDKTTKYKNIILKENISKKVLDYSLTIQLKIDKYKKIISNPLSPLVGLNSKCKKPYKCQFYENCWENIPENNVFELFSGLKRGSELYKKGVLSIKDIPKDEILTNNQKIQKLAVKNKSAYIDKLYIHDFLENIELPINFLDFEFCSAVIPFYDGMKPFEKIPFLYSLKILSDWYKVPFDIHFIDIEGTDPRRRFIDSLLDQISKDGSIIVYGKDAELGILNNCIVLFPDIAEEIKKLKKRIVDLLDPFKKFYYYDSKQGGSVSLKKVVPALTGIDYDMDISDGYLASITYFKLLTGGGSFEDVDDDLNNLKDYCKLDTDGMLAVLKMLKEVVG